MNKYQVIILGNDPHLVSPILESFFEKTNELGIDQTFFKVIYASDFENEFKSNNPSVCLYFTNGEPFVDLSIIDFCLERAIFILPIVQDLTRFDDLAPPQLKPINALQVNHNDNIETLLGVMLEAFSLLRSSRRIFISYKRSESSPVANQFYDHLSRCGFNVFLDSYSIRPGEPFQEELWHRLVDTDVVILLDTPGFLKSYWTNQELSEASAMGIMILQIIWPNNSQPAHSTLCHPYYLKKNSFRKRTSFKHKTSLSRMALKKIVILAESLRARSLASRQTNLISEFVSSAHSLMKNPHVQPDKLIILQNGGGQNIVIVPTIGVPDAFTLHQKENLIRNIDQHKTSALYLFYDSQNIKKKWLSHLDWLDGHLPVKAIKVADLQHWLTNNNIV
jgi:hypothetical protein